MKRCIGGGGGADLVGLGDDKEQNEDTSGEEDGVSDCSQLLHGADQELNRRSPRLLAGDEVGEEVVDVGAEGHEQEGDEGPHGEASGAHAADGSGGHEDPGEEVGDEGGVAEELRPFGLSIGEELAGGGGEEAEGFDEDEEGGDEEGPHEEALAAFFAGEVEEVLAGGDDGGDEDVEALEVAEGVGGRGDEEDCGEDLPPAGA